MSRRGSGALTRREALRAGAGAGAGLLLAGCGVQGGSSGGGGGGEKESDYPTRAVELVAPFSPGGSTDLISRAIAKAAKEPLGQAMVVVNREGANGAVGGREVVTGNPDGYRVVFLPTSLFTITPQVVKDADTLSLDDMRIITGLTVENIVLLSHRDSPYKTLDDLLKEKDSGKRVSYSHSGTGSGLQFAQNVFYRRAGINAADVPFDGAAPAITALLGKQVDAGASQIAESIKQVQAGELRHLGIFSAERSELLPDVPTMKEQGFDIQIDQVRFIAAPPKVPEDVATKLNEAFLAAAKDPDYDKFLKDNYIEHREISGDEVRKKVETDFARYKATIDELKIRPEASS